MVSAIQQARSMNHAEAVNNYQLLQYKPILALNTESLQFSK